MKFYGSNFQFLWENSRIVLQLIEDKRTHISVRAMQYVLDMTVNSKKPDDLVHKPPYKCYRIRPLVLQPLPEDFEKLAYSEKFS